MTLVLKPGYSFDSDASTYIDAVETADGQALETGVRVAINDFVLGCKQDEIWDAIKASCILAGARTTNGALVPLVGTAPTPNNFDLVGNTDYDRKTGLKGDGSTKELKTGVLGSSLPQNSFSLGLHVSVPGGSLRALIDGGRSLAGASNIVGGGGSCSFRNRNSTVTTQAVEALGFIGSSRSVSSAYNYRFNDTTYASSTASQTPNSDEITVFNFSRTPFSYSNARLSFYSIGESLDLAALDTRVSNLITAIGAAIP